MKAKVLLIRVGKMLPFILCALVALSFTETLAALCVGDIMQYEDSIIAHKPLSWALGPLFEYNIQTLGIIAVISLAIKTCIYNKAACLYLGVNLWEKSALADTEIYLDAAIALCAVNIALASFLVYKGIKVTIK